MTYFEFTTFPVVAEGSQIQTILGHSKGRLREIVFHLIHVIVL